jgi:hypothetical protein
MVLCGVYYHDILFTKLLPMLLKTLVELCDSCETARSCGCKVSGLCMIAHTSGTDSEPAPTTTTFASVDANLRIENERRMVLFAVGFESIVEGEDQGIAGLHRDCDIRLYSPMGVMRAVNYIRCPLATLTAKK